jgi:hypothetical protein
MLVQDQRGHVAGLIADKRDLRVDLRVVKLSVHMPAAAISGWTFHPPSITSPDTL